MFGKARRRRKNWEKEMELGGVKRMRKKKKKVENLVLKRG